MLFVVHSARYCVLNGFLARGFVAATGSAPRAVPHEMSSASSHIPAPNNITTNTPAHQSFVMPHLARVNEPLKENGLQKNSLG